MLISKIDSIQKMIRTKTEIDKFKIKHLVFTADLSPKMSLLHNLLQQIVSSEFNLINIDSTN